MSHFEPKLIRDQAQHLSAAVITDLGLAACTIHCPMVLCLSSDETIVFINIYKQCSIHSLLFSTLEMSSFIGYESV